MHSFTFEAPNLPVIPKSLVIPLSGILTSGLPEIRLTKRTGEIEDNSYYKVFQVNEDLNQWLKTIFDFSFTAEYIWQKNWAFKHRDLGRVTAYNYVIDPGGVDVATAFYDNNNEELMTESTVFETEKWYKLNVGLPHMVLGNKDGCFDVRYLLTVTPDDAAIDYYKLVPHP